MLNCHYCERFRAGKCTAEQPHIQLYRQNSDSALQQLIADCPEFVEADLEPLSITLTQRDALLLLWGYIPDKFAATLRQTLTPDALMVEVSSSNLKAVGYNPDSKVLYVDFHSGSRYTYADVPSDMHDEFLAAPSIGGFFNHNIKGNFKSDRLF
ncbi:MAG TPA: KTSC domain-containing protein [Stenomitos sp.]